MTLWQTKTPVFDGKATENGCGVLRHLQFGHVSVELWDICGWTFFSFFIFQFKEMVFNPGPVDLLSYRVKLKPQ